MLFILGWIMCPSLNRWHGNIDGIMLIKWVRAKLEMGSSVIQTIWHKKFGVLLRREERSGCWGGSPQWPPQWWYCLQIDGLFYWSRTEVLSLGQIIVWGGAGYCCVVSCAACVGCFNSNTGLCPLDASTSSPVAITRTVSRMTTCHWGGGHNCHSCD